MKWAIFTQYTLNHSPLLYSTLLSFRQEKRERFHHEEDRIVSVTITGRYTTNCSSNLATSLKSHFKAAIHL